VTPLNVSFDGINHIEDENFDFDQYYRNFEERKLFKVKTAQPSPAAFLDNYENLINEGYDHIICVTISSGLSGTYNSAVVASKQVEEDHNVPIDVIDGKSASLAVVLLLEKALELIEKGIDPKEIVLTLNEMVRKITTTLTLPTLKYLKAGGRVSTPKFLIGSIFGLKPITNVDYKTGENVAVGTVRSMDKGLQKVYELTTEGGKRLAKQYAITHTNDLPLAQQLVEIIRNNQPDVEIRIVRARSSISAHTGPGALALTALFDEQVR
jgi:DegV family protein with EDD domain